MKKWNYSSATNYAYPDSYICGSPSGHQLTTSFTYNAYTGQMATTTDPSNQVTSFAYDVMRRPTVTTRPDSVQLTTSYNDTNHSSTFTQPILGTNSLKTAHYLDGLARLANTISTDSSNNTYSNVQDSYDPLEKPYKVSDPFTGSPQYWKQANFDGVGRAVKTILQDNSQITYAYAGQYTTVTDPTGKQRKFQYDGAGRIVKIFEPDPSNNNSLTLQTTYTYTVLDKISSVTQGSQTRSYTFDGMGRLTSKATPEGGTTTYQYTNFDKVSQRTDARGVVTNYSYDNLNRLQQVSYNVGTTGVPATPTVIYTYGTDPTKYNNGRLLTVTDGPGSETYLYDLLGRVTQEQDVIGGNTYTIGYQYNSANELVSTTYPSQRVVQANYDNIGRLASLTSGSTTLASNISYNPNDQITGFTYGSGVSASYTYLPDRLQTQAMSYTKGGATLFGVTYSYSQNGGNDSEVTGITDSFDSGRNLTFTYDALRRLATANSQGSVNYPQWGLSFTYDRYGNRTAQTVTAGSGPSNSVSVSATTNRITTPGYSYDANGNMTSDGQNTIVYDAENRVVSDADGIGTATYLYQANGRRASKTVAGATTVYIYAGEHPIAEYVNGGLTNEYVYLSDQLLAGYISGTLYYYLPDRISIRAVTDSSGNLVAQQGHFPFGESWYSSGSATEFQFTNYIRDTESGNDYALSRYYINRLARFASLDPARGNTKDPQQWTRYSYVANDPVGRTDPTGLCGVVGRKCLPQMGGCSGCGGGCGCDAFIDPTGCMGCDPVADPLNCVPSFSGGGTGGCNPDIDPSCLFGGGCGCSAESPEGCGGGGGGSRGPGGINNLGKLVDSAACSRSNPNSLPRCNTCCNNASLVHFLACLAAGLLDPLAGEVCAEVSAQWDLECRTCCDQVLHTGKPCKLPYTGGSSVRIRSSIWEHY